jgi:cytochrome d ubiquinol oxidase subunit II
VLSGVVALVALALHGSAYLAVKTAGELNARSRNAVSKLWYVLVLVTILSLIGVSALREGILDNYTRYPIGWAIPAAVAASLAAIKLFNSRGNDKGSFLASSVYLAMMLVGAVFALYPNVLPAMDPANSLTIENASAGNYGLSVGLVWWSVGMIIALGYFVYLFRTFRGKVNLPEEPASPGSD